MRFRTTIQQSGKSTMGFEVPAEVVEGLGAGKRPPVTVTMNGYTYRNSVAVMGGKSWHVLQATGTKNPDTRARRIEKSVAALREGRIR